MKRPNKRVSQFAKLARSLRKSDPDIIEIVQFGSSVYAPRLARDVDLLILTRAKKEYDVYLDAVEGYPRNVDVVVKEPGESMGAGIALSILAFSKTLYGNGRTRSQAKAFTPIPNGGDARMYLTMADHLLEDANKAKDKWFREKYYRTAFDFLFGAARYAAMIFIATDETRWGELPKRLPAPFNKRFREFISKLHIESSYDGNYPKDRMDETFQEWRGKVEQFIEDLQAQSKEK